MNKIEIINQLLNSFPELKCNLVYEKSLMSIESILNMPELDELRAKKY